MKTDLPFSLSVFLYTGGRLKMTFQTPPLIYFLSSGL